MSSNAGMMLLGANSWQSPVRHQYRSRCLMQRVGSVATRCDFASLVRRRVVLFFNKFLKRFVTDCRTCFAVVFSPRFQVDVSLTVTKKRNIFYSFTTVELWRRKIRKKRKTINQKTFRISSLPRHSAERAAPADD